ncbi:hypothetical protein DM860_003439 [Cuscuta australis]|uniref:Mediator of RNA polymerase II transcription subunit 19 n=1 Tax=Cuscuta australis TaxID=267555 RepID=A0A328DHL6_9ASTE|nr:hypothetical protein DM860_003439 [Cuscuta australis]
MDPEGRKFGRGPREFGGSIDLINHYKIERFHEYFCKRTLPSSISKSQYLPNVAGSREIKKGEGMELDQLVQNPISVGRRQEPLCPFQLDVLMDAFLLRGSTSFNLSPVRKKEKKKASTGKKSKLRKHKKLKHKK